jgi:charged multivesicular body protein 6
LLVLAHTYIMGGAFSSSKSAAANHQKKSINRAVAQSQITDVDRAILDLKNARDRLTKYNVSLEKSIEQLVQRAKAAKETNRTSTALGLLRLKKYKQVQVESCQTQLLNVHQLLGTIDSQQRNADIVQSMKAGKDALAKLHAETTVEHVLDLMDAIQEEHALEQEYTAIINGAVPSLTVDQEEAVELELAALQAEMDGTDVQQQPVVASTEDKIFMPEVPNNPLPQIEQEPEKKTQTPQKQKQPERVPIAG